MGHIHTPLAFLHATPRRLLLGDAGSILPSPSFIATDLNWIYSGFFFLSLPCHVAAANSHPRDPFLLRTPRHALADVLHDSARSTRVTRTSSLSCVRRSRRPHAHCFYCTRFSRCSRMSARPAPDGAPIPSLLHATPSHSSLALCAIRIVCALCSPPYRCAYLPLPSLPSLLGLLQTLSVALTCVLLSQDVSHPTSIQIMPPTVFLLSLALRLVLASARHSHSLDSAS
ncbi:hypothetical protein B0H13DRAFT_2342234 [Mycena leptocephala]|nr:hypothetical protein B0H13DRAFT_2342234 [Mycena leptocephala]